MTGIVGEERALADSHALFAGGTAPTGVRDLVADSWARSAAAGITVDGDYTGDVVAVDRLTEIRDAHPLAHVFPLLYDVLGQAAEACDCLLAISDADGRLLWVCGPNAVVNRAESIGFVEGALWDESHAGTNAPGTALQLDDAVQIHAAEHFLRPVHAWSCAAAPIHDPATHEILGVVDVTGGADVALPQTLAMIRAAARMAETELARLAALDVAATARATAVAGTAEPRIGIAALGRPDCLIHLHGRTLRLSRRHSEIVVLLADHPDGLSGDELTVLLSETHISPSTLRAEMTRLRGLLGPDVLQSRPYRLRGHLDCDWRGVSALLVAGRLDDAVRGYRGPLLPQSEAPGVADHRESLTQQLRAAVLGSQRPELMVTWTRSRWGADDAQMWRAQAQALPSGSPLRPLATAEADRLEADLL